VTHDQSPFKGEREREREREREKKERKDIMREKPNFFWGGIKET
jgi:hypothetical protein